MPDPTSLVTVVRDSMKVVAVARCWVQSSPSGSSGPRWRVRVPGPAPTCGLRLFALLIPHGRRAGGPEHGGGEDAVLAALRVCGATPSQALRVCAATQQAAVVAGLSWIRFGPADRGGN
jgi:hypothetical protein